jgi:hypothetical protein
MRYARPALFYTFLAVFVLTAVMTFVGLLGIYPIADRYLNVLFASLLGEVIAAVVGLYKAADWFGRGRVEGAVRSIQGGWWQRVRTGTENVLGYVTVDFSDEEQQLRLVGDAYSAAAEHYAHFWSISASLNAASMELWYFWKGDRTSVDNDFSGVGYLRYERRADAGLFDLATGWFTTGNLEKSQVEERRKVEMIRASAEEARTMEGGDPAAKRELIGSMITRLRLLPTPTVGAGAGRTTPPAQS